MDRSYLAPHRVNVYATQADKEAGNTLDCVLRVPYSRHGFDYYEFKGRVLPGYIDGIYEQADACVVLTDPSPGITA